MVGQRESLLLVIDTSGSMGEVFEGGITKLEAAIRAGANLILHKVRIDPLDEIGVVSFTDRAIVEFAPASCGSDKSDMIRSLQQLTPGGGTDLDAGLRAAETALPWGRSDLTRRIVMLTDGNGGHPLRTATSLKSRGVVLDVIGVGESPNDVDEKLLRALASVVAGELRYRFIKNQAALVTRYTALANKTQLATP
jgi:Mg-chelatase subunit ChlD